ncbi:MAG: ATPase [Saprospiraceae bacterium]
MSKPVTLLCISSYFKGSRFLTAAKAAGAKVLFVTSKKLENKPWPHDSIDEIFYVEQNEENEWHMPDVISGLAWVMRANKVDRIVALDDFDVEKAAELREHFRVPGMGQTTCRHFRDKLAMRMKAQEQGVPVPAFSPLFNDDEINAFADSVPAPWIVKARTLASATGMKKVYSKEELWDHLNSLEGERHQYLVEQFKPGDVYHVDALSVGGKTVFASTSKYLATPFEVAHGGGIFRSAVLPFGGEENKSLKKLTDDVMKAFGMKYSASHTEFIKCHEDGKYYFLETSSRVGGAHLSEMVEYSAGINVWEEWAKIEVAEAGGSSYSLPKINKDYAGIVVSLARQEWPDTSQITDPEIVWRLTDMKNHVGLIVQSSKHERVLELLDKYADIVARDYHASAPIQDKPNT